MKARRIFNIMFIVCCFVSCQANKGDNNVILTDFTKDLISLYVNDPVNIKVKNRKNEIIVTAFADTSYYYLSVFANNCKEYKFCKEDFIGEAVCLGHLVRIFGDENSIFYFVKEKSKKQKIYKDNFIEHDPNVWHIVFNKDKSFNKMRTYKTIHNEDISDIQSLAEKYFTVSQTTISEVYHSYEVENESKFVFGEDSLRQIISSNFKIHKEGSLGKVPLVVNIIVDEKGKATLGKIAKSSNDIELDNEAIRVAEIICQYDFIPASHRGETVRSIYPIVFLRSDITP